MEKILNKKIFIIIISLLAVILCVCMMILNYFDLQQQNRETAEITGNFNSIKDILEYYGCKHIKTKKSDLEDFSFDIYTSFKYNLYDDEESNEDFYNKIINKIAQFLNYKSYRLIDETKDEKIEIQVICDGKTIKKIIINGIEDYFLYMDSMFDAKKYKIIDETDIKADSPELIECIQNEWDTSIKFGTRESIFQKYDIYFDEGIKARRISNKIYNIVFTNKYSGNVINGLSTNADKEMIIQRLGNPTFKSQDGKIIGYKEKDIYVFFSDNEISIYRNFKEDYDTFFKLIDKFTERKCTFLEMMNELTYIWPDYETYEYSADTVFLSYPNKGIDVKINYNGVNGIVLYNNIGIENKVVKEYLKNTDFVSNRKIDNVYNAELRRYKNQNELNQKCDEYQNEKEKNENRSSIYKYYMVLDSNENIKETYFVSQSENYFNNQLIENIDSYIWLNDVTFIYSKAKRGIYSFNLESGEKNVIVTGKDDFKINSIENGILIYDDENSISF